MFTKKFLTALAERAIKTYAQAALAILSASSLNLLETDWVGVGAAAGMATLLSVLTSIASSGVTGSDGPSLGAETLK